jgi:hypothetical protein
MKYPSAWLLLACAALLAWWLCWGPSGAANAQGGSATTSIAPNFNGTLGKLMEEGTIIQPWNGGPACNGQPVNGGLSLSGGAYTTENPATGQTVTNGMSAAVGMDTIALVGNTACSNGQYLGAPSVRPANSSGAFRTLWENARGLRGTYQIQILRQSDDYVFRRTGLWVPSAEGAIRILIRDAQSGGLINRPSWAEQPAFELTPPGGPAFGRLTFGNTDYDYTGRSGTAALTLRPTTLNGSGWTCTLNVPHPTQGVVNLYTIYYNSSTAQWSSVAGSSNVAYQEPSSGTTGGSSGGTYTGPPGERNWWTDMLAAAFVPSQTTLASWQTWYNKMKMWGPFGYVNAWFGAFNAYPFSPIQHFLLIRVTMFGADMELDFRPGPDPDLPESTYASPGVARTRGTVYGQLRAALRTALGWVVIAGGAFGLYRWLRPRPTV